MSDLERVPYEPLLDKIKNHYKKQGKEEKFNEFLEEQSSVLIGGRKYILKNF
jgi:hypothetical protein